MNDLITTIRAAVGAGATAAHEQRGAVACRAAASTYGFRVSLVPSPKGGRAP